MKLVSFGEYGQFTKILTDSTKREKNDNIERP